MVDSQNWKILTIEDLTKIFTKQTGFDYSAYIKPTLVQEYRTGYIPFIQNKDFEGKLINYETDYYIPENVAKNFPRILLNENCLLISISGSIGNVAVFSNKQMAFIGGAVAVGKFKDKELLDWCMYYLLSNEGQNKLLGNVKAGSHQNLILDDLRKIEIPIPPKEEQKAIAKALSDTDELITTLEKLISKKEAIKQGTMQQLLTGKKRLSGFSGEWEEKRLGDIGNPTMCKRIMKYQTSDSGDVPFYKIGTFGKEADSYISNELFTEYKNRFSFPKKGDVLISASGTIGRIVVFDGKPSYFQDSNIVWIDNNEKTVTNKYLSFLYQIIKWTTEDTTIARLYNDNLKNIEISVPPTIEEQQAIAKILSDMDNKIESLKSKLSKTKAIKDGMMSELLTGKTRLK